MDIGSFSLCYNVANMLSLLKYFLMAMGVLFVGLLLGAWYVWETNLWNVRTVAPLVLPNDPETATSSASGLLQLPVLLEDPEYWLEQMDASTRECLVAIFGEARVAEIEAGAEPTTAELVAGIECLE